MATTKLDAKEIVKNKDVERVQISEAAVTSIRSLNAKVVSAQMVQTQYITGLAEGMGVNNKEWQFEPQTMSFFKPPKKVKKDK